MAWEFSSDKPIFQQLVERITVDIISGKFRPGDKLLPVRDLALLAGVNPNTMQRALTEIEGTGVIYTKRGDGRYVCENPQTMEDVRADYASKNTEVFVTSMKSLGLKDADIIETVKKQLEGLADGK